MLIKQKTCKSGTNDFCYNIDTLYHTKEIIKLVKEIAPNVKRACTPSQRHYRQKQQDQAAMSV
jgi:hypothetical protein